MFKYALLSTCFALTACTFPPAGRPLDTGLQAQSSHAIDDSDLGGSFRPQTLSRLQQEGQLQGEALVFSTRSQAPRLNRTQNSISARLFYTDAQGQVRPLAQATATLYQGERRISSAITNHEGTWQMPLPLNGRYSIRYTLENPRWSLGRYVWQGPEVSIPGTIADTFLEPNSQNGQAAWIHEVFVKALDLFEREQVPLNWWKRQIQTRWPGDGNYYSNYTVTLTGAEQWDVNGHELGHAIYHQAINARSQGGQHKIDECYSPTLALSEGFASFFSGAVHLSPDDEDARFGPYLVPRRAPVRVENVPEDVCKGARNEWRVAALFWDIFDRHPDGPEALNLNLKTIFAALGQGPTPMMNSALDAYPLLKQSLPPDQHAALAALFRHNTMEITQSLN